MSLPYACWEKIVGLSRTDCDCYTGTMPPDAGESASELWLDELPGMDLEMIKAAATCATGGDMWLLLQRALEEGIKKVKADGLRGISANTQWKRAPVISQISDIKNARQDVNLTSAFHGVTIRTAHQVGAWMRVKKIGTLMKFTGSFDVSVYGVENDDVITTVSVTAEDSKLTWTDVDILLSMETEGIRNPQYWFLFDGGLNRQALNARLWCTGCGKGPSWDDRNPWFESSIKQNTHAWTKWAMAGGTKGTTLADRDTWSKPSETQGLILNVEFGCDASLSLCNGTPDYQNDPIQNWLAHAVREAAAIWMLEVQGVSRNVTREALAGNEELSLLKVKYVAHYTDIMEKYISVVLSNPPDEGNPHSGVNTYAECFMCKDKGGPKVRTMYR